ncbi:hypothetical protein KP509_27G044200 [Ceratopteris richardii]|nr:hypothetical protein KP509_27G044200 [Ceratopteris richardii]
MDVFRPLVLEEFRAQMQQSYQQLTFSDDTTGIFRLMSVEKIDDFDVGRFTGEPGADGLASSCFENDLLLLSRLPFQVSDQEVHMIGKVERQERDNKSRSVIVTLRFYLRSGNKRLAKARTLLLERSKWHVTRLMSITPQIREFQAVSAVARLPLLPLILNDKSCKVRPLDAESGQQLNHMLPDKLHDQLKAEYNTSQMKSIYMALKSGAIANDHEMSLVQGPPGTGKTRTIVAIISALVASMKGSKGVTDVSIPDTRGYPRKPVKESVAIARSWQAAALAKQQMQVEASEMIQKERGKGVRILVCAQSNAAVDELVHRIRKHGLYNTSGCSYQPSIVRVGNARTVHPNSLPVFIDTLVERQMQADKENVDGNASKSHTELVRNKLRKILDSVQVLESRLSKLQWTDMQSKSAAQDPVSEIDDVEADLRLEMRALYKQRNQTYRELTELEAGERRALEVAKSKRVELKRDIIRQAEIVLATLNVCGGDVYSACIDKSSGRRQHRNPNDGLFDAVIIDEAAQALEPATLIPLQLLKTSRAKCIMVGDPKQLPATIISQRATKFSFECSLFERLQKGGHPVSLLNVQYRMHPEICCFPSAHFYDGQLESGNGLLEKRKAMFHENKFLGPYAVFDVVDGYERVGHQSASQSLCNEAEAEMVLELFSYLRARYPQDVNAGRVGIITPYQQQLSLLKEQFRRSLGRTVTEGIEFNTVDGFQGREVDIIIFSTVRAMRSAQSSCRIGFVADVRRMNVAITRARFSLWIVCNASTLQGSPSWAALLKNARNRGLIQQVRRPYKVAFENENLKEHIELSISAPVVSLLSCRKSSPQEHDTKANTEAVIEKKVQESSTSSLKMLNSGCLNLVSNIDKREGNLEIKSGYSCSRNGSELRKGKVLDEVGSKNLSNSYRASSIPSLKALENKSKKSMKSGSDARHPESVIHKKPCYEKEFQGLEGSKVFLEQENLGQHVCDTHSGSKHQNATYGEERSAGVQVLEELQQHDRTGHHNQLKSTCSEKNFEQETNLSKDRDTSRFLKSSSDISDPDNNKIKGKRNRSVAVHARDSRVSQPFGSDCKVKILSTGPGVADDEIIDTLTHTWPEKNDKYSELSRPPKRIRRDFVAGIQMKGVHEGSA